jgi:DNA-binding NarL/FixJ family response regulator
VGGLQDFIQAVRTVASGGAYFGPEASAIVDRLVKAKAAKVTRTEASPAPASAARPRASDSLPPFSYALG